MPGLQQLFRQSLQLLGIRSGVNRPRKAFYLKLLANREFLRARHDHISEQRANVIGGHLFLRSKNYVLAGCGQINSERTLQSDGLTGLISLFDQCSSESAAFALVRHVQAIQLACGRRRVGLGYFCPSRHSSLLFSPGSTPRSRHTRLKMS